jgi:aspartate/methionine/tyrosine aminotransferase
LVAGWRVADGAFAGLRGYSRPAAGFFLWLTVSEGESMARRLWRDAAVRTLPGAYLTASAQGDADAARARIRLALVHPAQTLEPALLRVRAVVSPSIDRSVS